MAYIETKAGADQFLLWQKLAFNTFPHFTNQQMFGSLRMGKKYFKYLR